MPLMQGAYDGETESRVGRDTGTPCFSRNLSINPKEKNKAKSPKLFLPILEYPSVLKFLNPGSKILVMFKILPGSWAMVAHAFNPNI